MKGKIIYSFKVPKCYSANSPVFQIRISKKKDSTKINTQIILLYSSYQLITLD